MKPKILLLTALLLVSCSPVRGCVESSFTLAPESRLPKWFALPSEYARESVTVRLYYYSSPFPVNDAEFVLMDRYDEKLAMVAGEMCWHPEMEKKRNSYGVFDPDLYPHYVFVRINGMLEVIEHLQGQTFRVSDDPKLVKEAVASKDCKKQ